MITSFLRVPCHEIVVLRDERQRREINTDDLDAGIKRNGVLQPIVITRSLQLVAGERRLSSSIKLGLPDIPAVFVEDLPAEELKLLELEENIKRQDITWQERVKAVHDLHQIYIARDPKWSQERTANEIGVSIMEVSRCLRVYEDKDHPLVAKAATAMAARNYLDRIDQRRKDQALGLVMESAAKAFRPPDFIEPPPEPESIIDADFLEWAPRYEGPRFNFIHCDFPFGIEFNKGEMGGKNKEGSLYQDKPDIYWELLYCLCNNLDRLLLPSAHLMFWFSMEHYQKTLYTFAEMAPDLQINRFPLIWTKSDNVGVLPDAKRGPRRVYETCFIGSREDRLIIKPVANSYAAPSDKSLHPSTKPEPMLRFYFQMFVDGTTRLLDPTCGSGSALRAAESLGAESVFGLEPNKEYRDAALTALKKFRSLRKATKS